MEVWRFNTKKLFSKILEPCSLAENRKIESITSFSIKFGNKLRRIICETKQYTKKREIGTLVLK